MTRLKPDEFKSFLINFVLGAIPNKTYDSSAKEELKELTNQFVDKLDEQYTGRTCCEYWNYLTQSMSETNKRIFEFDTCFVYYAMYLNALINM